MRRPVSISAETNSFEAARLSIWLEDRRPVATGGPDLPNTPDPPNGLDLGSTPDDLKVRDTEKSGVLLIDTVLVGVAAFVSVSVIVLVGVLGGDVAVIGGDWVRVRAGDVAVLGFVSVCVFIGDWERVWDVAGVCE